jgi:hypothetical protein
VNELAATQGRLTEPPAGAASAVKRKIEKKCCLPLPKSRPPGTFASVQRYTFYHAVLGRIRAIVVVRSASRRRPPGVRRILRRGRETIEARFQ